MRVRATLKFLYSVFISLFFFHKNNTQFRKRMGRVPTAKQELRKLQEQFLARANAPPLQKKAPRSSSSSSNSNVAKISLRAIVQLANSVATGTWKRLAHPNVVAGLLMAPFMESPDRIVEPPPAIGKYNPISPALVQSILPAEHPNFEGLCQYLGNALGIWADYFPWSNVFAPMILSPSFEHRHWACRGKLMFFLLRSSTHITLSLFL